MSSAVRSYRFDPKTQKFVLIEKEVSRLHYVQPDIADFRSADGAHISGRSHWREHLKRTGAVEMGHSDIKAATESWNKRKAAFQDRIKGAESTGVRQVETPVVESCPMDRTRLSSEMANRLYNRPSPDRKTMIKLTLETAKDLARRR